MKCNLQDFKINHQNKSKKLLLNNVRIKLFLNQINEKERSQLNKDIQAVLGVCDAESSLCNVKQVVMGVLWI